MRALALVSEEFGVFCNGGTTIKSADTNIGHVLGETSVLIFNLECEFASVAEDEDRNFSVDRFQLLKGSQDENGSFSVTGFCLTQDVHAEYSLRNAFLLD